MDSKQEIKKIIFDRVEVVLLMNFRVSLGVRTCELFLCFVAIVRVRAIVLTSLFSLFYVTGEFHRFLHRGRAELYYRIVTSHSLGYSKRGKLPFFPHHWL